MNSRKALLGVILTLFFCFPLFLLSEQDGPEPRRTNGKLPNGQNFPGEDTCGNSECHNVTPNTGAGGVEISINGGPIENYSYAFGETVPVMVRVFDPDPLQQRFGFQITSRTSDGCQQAGTFATSGAPNGMAIQIIEDFDQFDPCPPPNPGIQFPEHFFARFGPDAATFEVNWTAPAGDIGPIIFAAGGNAGNGDQEDTGDSIYHSQGTVEAKGGPPPPPTHEVTGVCDAAGCQELISPGSYASVFGFFAEQTVVPDTVPLSMNVNGFSVTFNGIPGAVHSVFAGEAGDQTNVQVPWGIDVSSGTVEVQVHWEDDAGTVLSEPFTANAAQASPGLFLLGSRAIVTNFSLGGDDVITGSWAQPEGFFPDLTGQPAAIGGVITVWCGGLDR